MTVPLLVPAASLAFKYKCFIPRPVVATLKAHPEYVLYDVSKGSVGFSC